MKNLLFVCFVLVFCSCQKEILFDSQSQVLASQISVNELSGITTIWLDRMNQPIVTSESRKVLESAKDFIAQKDSLKRVVVKFEGSKLKCIEN